MITESIIWFLAGGYIVPALFHTIAIASHIRRTDINAPWVEIILTAVLNGGLWPLMSSHTDRRGE